MAFLKTLGKNLPSILSLFFSNAKKKAANPVVTISHRYKWFVMNGYWMPGSLLIIEAIVNTSVKDALNDFCQLQVTCKGLAGYMGHKYKNSSYKEHTIKGFRLTYDEFRDFLDVSG